MPGAIAEGWGEGGRQIVTPSCVNHLCKAQYFFFLFFGFLSWPLWSVAAWYVFWNIWDYLFRRDGVAIGFAAHLAGAAMGLLIGVALFREKRHWVAGRSSKPSSEAPAAREFIPPPEQPAFLVKPERQ